MALHPTSPSRERILGYGPWGSGKSYMWIKLAQWMVKTGSESKLYIAGTHGALERDLEGWEHPNIVDQEVTEHTEIVQLLSQWKNKATRDDWLVIDMIDGPWAWAQDAYALSVMGKGMTEWLIDTKVSNMGKGPGESRDTIAGAHGENWGMINALYREFINLATLRWPGHVLALTGDTEIRQPSRDGKGGDDKAIREVFGRIGRRPEGQKGLGYQFHTVLYLPEAGKVVTAKEKIPVPGAEGMRVKLGGDFRDFVVDYLMGVAKWKL